MKAQTAGWAGLLAVLFGLQQFSVQEHYRTLDALAEWRADAALLDTVTYQDERIVYTVASVLDTHIVGTDTFIRRLPDLAAAPAGARFEVLWKPTSFDSVMLVTGDTFALSPTDSLTAYTRSGAWGVSDPKSIDLAWHTPSTPFLNEPASFVELTTHRFTDTFNAPDSDWAWSNGAGNFSLVTGQTPGSPSPDTVGYVVYPDGFAGGSAPGNWYTTNAGADIDSLQSDSIYTTIWLKVSSNFYGHTSGVNKVIFTTTDGYASNPLYTSVQGSGNGVLLYQVRSQGTTIPNTNFTGNTAYSDTITRNTWHKIEHLYILNTTSADSNGVVKVWIDGLLTHDYTNAFLWNPTGGDSTAYKHEWNNTKWNPYWGGTGGSLDIGGDSMYMWLDHFYVSGSNNL